MNTISIDKIVNAKLDNTSGLHSISILAGKITAIEAMPARPEEEVQTEVNPWCGVWNANGNIVLPGLIDIHTHLDKNYTPATNSDGTLLGAIKSMQEYKACRSATDIAAKAKRGINAAISNGVQLLRSHIDLSSEADLDTIRILNDVRKEFADKIQIDITALGPTETATDLELMRSALDLGVNMIGGAPALSDSPHASIKNAVELAKEFSCGLDLHIDEQEDPSVLTLEILADQCLYYNIEQSVLASHCCALAYVNQTKLDEICEKLMAANISIVSLPICNLTLMGRNQNPVTRGIAPIKYLLAKGVNVAVGSDNVQDPFNPFGDYDPLRVVNIATLAGHFNIEAEIIDALKLVTSNAAKAIDMKNYGIRVGADANLCITNTTNMAQCATAPPDRLATIFKGNLTFQKKIEYIWN